MVKICAIDSLIASIIHLPINFAILGKFLINFFKPFSASFIPAQIALTSFITVW